MAVLEKPSLISSLVQNCKSPDYAASFRALHDCYNPNVYMDMPIYHDNGVINSIKHVEIMKDLNSDEFDESGISKSGSLKRLINKWPRLRSPTPKIDVSALLHRLLRSGLQRNHNTALQALLSIKISYGNIISDEDKLTWLRSQLIGENGVNIETPFGKLPLLYVDHTASGKPIKFIEDFIMEHVLPSYGNTHTEDSYVGQTTTAMMHAAQSYVKKQLLGFGKEVEHALLFCGNGCTAAVKRLQEIIGVAAPSNLRNQILESGILSADDRWIVFVGPYEHHSNLLSWRQSLAEVVEIPADAISGEIDMKVLEEALEASRGRRFKLGAFSACSNVTGLLTDTRAVARLFHKHGGYVCFDFAAGAPHRKIEMVSGEEDMYYDAVVLSPHKLPGGPGTPGLLLLRKELYLLQGLPPTTCGGGTVAYVNGFNEEDTIYYKDIEEREDAGTPSIIGKLRCALLFWMKDFMSETMITQREKQFLAKAILRLSTNPNIKILGPISSLRFDLHKHVPIISFIIYSKKMRNSKIPTKEEERMHHQNEIKSNKMRETYYDENEHKPLHGRLVVRLLNDLFGIQSRGGCACAGPYGHTLLNVNKEQSLAIRKTIMKGYEGLKPGWTRVSFGYNMLDFEVDYVLSAIEFIATYGHHFLQLYTFNCHTGNWTIQRDNKYYNCIRTLIQKSNIDMHNHHDSYVRRLTRIVKAFKSHLSPMSQSHEYNHVVIPNNIDRSLILFSI